MVRRRCVVPVEPQEQPQSKVHRCASCGAGLHGNARRQYICSWCKGDPDHGCDGYFNDIIDDLMARVCPPEMTRAMVRDMLLQERRRS